MQTKKSFNLDLEQIIIPYPITLTGDTCAVNAVKLMTQVDDISDITEDLKLKNYLQYGEQSCCVLVLDQEHLVGIFTKKDILNCVEMGINLEQVTLAEVMREHPITLKKSEFTNISVVLNLFQTYKIHHVVVVNDEGALVGIITPNSIFNTFNPLQMYEENNLLRQKVSQLEIEKAEILQKQSSELENQVHERTTELIEQIKIDHLLVMLSQKIRNSFDLDVILQTAVSEIQNYLQVDRVIIYEFNREWSGRVVAESLKTEEASLLGVVLHDPCFAPDWVEHYTNGRVRKIHDIYDSQLSPCHIQLLAENHIRANLVVPIVYQNQLWGLIGAHQASEPRIWQSLEVELLENLSVQLAIAIQQSQLYQQVQKELKERIAAQSKLRRLNKTLEQRVIERTEELYESQEYLRQITENIDSVFWIESLETGQILYVSPAYQKIWGYSCRELYQSPYKWLDSIHPEDLPQIMAALSKKINGEYNEQYRIIRSDGEIRWIYDRAFPICDQEGNIYRIAGIAEDITQQKQIEETLKLQERAIAASNNGIIIVDARLSEKKTIFVNTAFEKITGYSAQEVIGRNCRFLQGNDQQQTGLQTLRTAIQNQTNCLVTIRNYRKDGSLFWNELSISPIYDDQGNLTHFIGIQNDVTARKLAEEQIKSSLQEKEILLKEVHHRVKNNLLVVSSLLYWQAEYLADPVAIKIFEQSQYRIQSMALIHEKLYQSKNLAEIDLSEYLQTVAQQLESSLNLESKTITINFDLQPIFLNIETVTPCGLIINELICNAFEHAFPNHETGQIWIRVKENAQKQVTITIEDNGVGFPADLDFQNTESLGLQLICLLTKQLDGKITVSSHNGTAFTLTFSELRYRQRIENYDKH
ncbi:PAS domain S-box protein [Dolichospermum sp. UHCC 0259]|uniref:PAS domain S-box protein n=1 Tax=Dolichospermum sp. UHCC 0259 TaxID=2590010 RepID=UPI001448617E|nr:PAS domain S-box protein [Dolichospermum sp. UHCC 0259]MTJ49836.1 PAS domain S-box protein [Dolichospermum sp. UHCC 0259]